MSLSKLKLSSTEIKWLKKNSAKLMGEYHRAFCLEFGRSDLSVDQLRRFRKYHGWKTSGRGPHNAYKPGQERVVRDGFVELCIDDPDPKTDHKYRWVRKHRWIWEKQNGKIPDGLTLKCIDGDRSNCEPSNWELLHPSTLPALCIKRGYDSAPDELKPTILAVTKLEYSLWQKAKGNR